MTEGIVMDVFADALMTAFKLAAPPLLVSLFIGLIIAIMQAATQVHEQTLTFVPKLAAIAIVLLVTGAWMIEQMTDFMYRLFDTIARYA